MTLSEYIRTKEITHQRAADGIGVSIGGLRKLARGERHPRKEVIERIAEWSGGEVGISDWFNVPAPGDVADRKVAA